MELLHQSSFCVLAVDADPALGRDLDDLRPAELQVAFDAAGRGLALPPVEDAVETGFAVGDVQRHLVGADPPEHGAERLLDRVAAPARAARGLERRRGVDLDREHRRIGHDFLGAELGAQRLRLERGRGRLQPGVRLVLALARDIDTLDLDAGHHVTGIHDAFEHREEEEREDEAAERERADEQHAPPGGRAGANDRAGVRRDGPHRTGRLPKGSRGSSDAAAAL